jgi:hypothetical protein
MRTRIAVLLLALGLLVAGCLLPARGTPVFVDRRAGDFWTGEGMLLEVSSDQQRCRVAVRDRALYVRHMWVECRFVHALSVRDQAPGSAG